jgi:hypothetical protein
LLRRTRRNPDADFTRAGMNIRLHIGGRGFGVHRIEGFDLALDRGLEQRRPECHPPQKIESTQGKQESDPYSHEIAGMQAGKKAGFTFFHGRIIPHCDRAATGTFHQGN